MTQTTDTTTSNTPQLPDELLKAAKNNQLIPIIGAGVSMSVSKTIQDENGETKNVSVFPSWKELLLRAADEVAKHDEDQATMVEISVKKQKWQRAAEDAKEGLEGEAWNQFLDKQFNIDHNLLNPLSASLPQAIWQLSDNIISLNYDKIQQHYSPAPANVVAFDNTNTDQLVNFAANEQPAHKKFIWHLHGHIDTPANIVLTPLSYQALYEQNQYPKAAIEKLKSLVLNQRLLFVGCSLDDAELINLITQRQQLFGDNSKTHYALVHANEEQAIKQKLAPSNAKIKLIPFNDFGKPLIDLIEQISGKCPDEQLPVRKPTKPKQRPQNNTPDNNPILLLTANPLDWLNDNKTYNAARHNTLINTLKKSPYGITHKPLTEENLLNADDYQYIIIASRVEAAPNELSPAQLLIENEYLHSDTTCLTQALNNLSDCSGVFCLLEAPENYQHANPTTNAPVVFSYSKTDKETKNLVGAFISQWLKGFKPKFFERNGINVINQGNFKEITPTSSKQSTGASANQITHHTSALPNLIDPNNLKNFIGRNDILQTLTTVLIDQQQDKIITIKGQGGMGKTTLAKKLAVALAQHNIFTQGISFIDCESIDSFAGFIRQIAESFNLGQVQNPLEQINSVEPQNKLLILDNFETILALSSNNEEQEKKQEQEQGQEQTKQCIDLVKTIYQKCNILITSRQGLNLTIEDIYPIDQLSTTDAQELFINLSGNKIKNLKIKNLNEPNNSQLLTEIVDKQLNHNPLAITLICQNLIAGDSLATLNEALLKNPFAELTQAEQHQFDTDSNSDRLKSIYNSIMYSYQTLKDDEKRTFELLSLFPDGLEYQTFERFVKNAQTQQHWSQQNTQQTPPQITKSAITRNAIKTLTDKSLLENNLGHIGLQSLLGKFAELQLQKRPNQLHFYQQMLNHMQTFVSGLTEEHKRDEISALKSFNNQYNNILKAIEAYFQLNPNLAKGERNFNQHQQQQFDEFVINTRVLAVQACNLEGLIYTLQKLLAAESIDNKLAPLSNNFMVTPSTALIQALLLTARYYNGDFKASFNKLQQSLPLIEINKLCQQQGANLSNHQRRIIAYMVGIYSMEGHALEAALVRQQLHWFDYYYSAELFYLGEYQQQLADNCHLAYPNLASLSVKAFFIQQNALQANDGSQTQIISLADQTLATLAESNHLQRIHILYFKSQYTRLALTDINALVEVNPFITGLKQLMLAFNTQCVPEQDALYLQAINNLEHIKYYWVEAKWHYIKFLIASDNDNGKGNNAKQIATLITEGQTLCQQYHYRYLHYRFNSLHQQINGLPTRPYNSDDYPLPGNPDFTTLINGNNKDAKWHYKTYKVKN